jgi:hypothetical protein
MKTIWRYPVPIQDKFELEVPGGWGGAEVLDVRLQHGQPFVWIEVETNAEKQYLSFRVLGTGNPITESLSGWGYIGTFVQDPFVWHLYCEQAKRS